MSLDLTREFDIFVKKCKTVLINRNRIIEIKYCSAEPTESVALNLSNVSKLRRKSNIYAIWTKGPSDNVWQLVYIGQRKSDLIHARLVQHLFKKSKGTGSNLERVKIAIDHKCQIGITTAMIQPEDVRLSVEARLITDMKNLGHCAWNIRT